MDRAACLTEDPSWFLDAHWIGKARKVCAGCPVLMECMASAVVEEWHHHGNSVATVRGGMTPHGRTAFRREIERRLEPERGKATLSRSGTL